MSLYVYVRIRNPPVIEKYQTVIISLEEMVGAFISLSSIHLHADQDQDVTYSNHANKNSYFNF